MKEITTLHPVGRGEALSAIVLAQVTISGEIIRVNQANTCPCVHTKYLFQRIWQEGLDRGGKVSDQESGITVMQRIEGCRYAKTAMIRGSSIDIQSLEWVSIPLVGRGGSRTRSSYECSLCRWVLKTL